MTLYSQVTVKLSLSNYSEDPLKGIEDFTQSLYDSFPDIKFELVKYLRKTEKNYYEVRVVWYDGQADAIDEFSQNWQGKNLFNNEQKDGSLLEDQKSPVEEVEQTIVQIAISQDQEPTSLVEAFEKKLRKELPSINFQFEEPILSGDFYNVYIKWYLGDYSMGEETPIEFNENEISAKRTKQTARKQAVPMTEDIEGRILLIAEDFK
jgi:hypothetical protein